VPPEKIIVGIGFYGQQWNGVSAGSNANAPGLFRPFTTATTPDWSDIKQYYLRSDSGYTRYWDNIAKAPFLYNGDRLISYTDHEQIREITGYVKAKNLGGVFSWEYGHDMDGELLKTMAEGSL
jgi:chitinase